MTTSAQLRARIRSEELWNGIAAARQAEIAARQLVYFIQAKSGPIKIGVAEAPPARLGSLQTANHEKLTLLHVVPGGVDMEKRLHAKFQHLHIHGEWYRGRPDLKLAIRRIIKQFPAARPLADIRPYNSGFWADFISAHAGKSLFWL